MDAEVIEQSNPQGLKITDRDIGSPTCVNNNFDKHTGEKQPPAADGVGAGSAKVTHSPPILQISRAPDDHTDDGSNSEYESFPENDSDDGKTEIIVSHTSRTSNGKEEGENMKEDLTNDVAVEFEKDWEPPAKELQEKIVKQVEFYFSDANITKDAFLLKHVKRNKHGYVSIKLISSFKKIKKLSKDWKSVSYSLKELSTKLDVNSEGTKVKRKDPLPDYDLTTPARTVVATNFSSDSLSVEEVKEMFKSCGTVSLVRIVRPGKPFPSDVKNLMERHVEVTDKVCALIEFENSNSAWKAVKTMNDDSNWRSGLCVTFLEKFSKKDRNHEQLRGKGDAGSDRSEGESQANKKKKKKNKKGRVDELQKQSDHSVTPSSSETENSPSPHRKLKNKPIPIPHQNKSPHHLSPTGTPKSSPCPSPHGSPRSQRRNQGRSHTNTPLSASPHLRGGPRGSPRASPHASPELRRKGYDKENLSDSSNSPSPWVQRRRMLAAQQGGSPGGSPMLTRRMLDPTSGAKPHMSDFEGIVRQPKGPESGQAFYGGKGRGKPIVS